MSLARAFTYGGVPATIMSLWKASDTKTPEIMVNFYKNLSTGMRKDEALCLAKRQYLTEHNASECNPFFWAVFVGAGDMRAISGMR
jgi:CHAT domain-containing protein